jgi:hypothetical protein
MKIAIVSHLPAGKLTPPLYGRGLSSASDFAEFSEMMI